MLADSEQARSDSAVRTGIGPYYSNLASRIPRVVFACYLRSCFVKLLLVLRNAV